MFALVEVLPQGKMTREEFCKLNIKIPDKLLEEWIRKSYNLVVAGLPKKLQKELDEE